ncbi:TadE-like protein [Burkholderia sp. 8Y]|uniref:TadE/TadG family type IV pilus assembly protein n=1 Tax=Burkholderia sp. 8Y TaxID=2653133 RepID=UPI0012F13F79|nr:TadE/TadG family type IV pilus assembly protein [Burkholderia sp. 8Y]VXC72613.1 TadE-like protein [Burkholderia sp. 8Y]
MTFARPLLRLLARFSLRLLRSNVGSVTVEFVIITPLMCLVLSGFAEIYLYMRAASTLEHTAFTLADSIGQFSQIIDSNTTANANNLGALWAAASLLAAPTGLQTNGAVFITAVCDLKGTSDCKMPGTSDVSAADQTDLTKTGTPYRSWQRAAPWNASGLASQIGTTNMLPATWPFRVGDSAVIVEILYNYDPWAATRAFWSSAPGTRTIYQRIYVRTRNGLPLSLSASS